MPPTPRLVRAGRPATIAGWEGSATAEEGCGRVVRAAGQQAMVLPWGSIAMRTDGSGQLRERPQLAASPSSDQHRKDRPVLAAGEDAIGRPESRQAAWTAPACPFKIIGSVRFLGVGSAGWSRCGRSPSADAEARLIAVGGGTRSLSTAPTCPASVARALPSSTSVNSRIFPSAPPIATLFPSMLNRQTQDRSRSDFRHLTQKLSPLDVDWTRITSCPDPDGNQARVRRAEGANSDQQPRRCVATGTS